MTFTIEWDDVEPFLPTLKAAQIVRAEAWLPVLALHLDARYGAQITAAVEPAFFSAAADAIEDRLQRPGGGLIQQSIGPASARYSDRSALLRWFPPERLDELDVLVGLGGIRTVRTPAPDAIRYGNLSGGWPDTEDESDEGDEEEGS
jgi:hypothetical protein